MTEPRVELLDSAAAAAAAEEAGVPAAMAELSVFRVLLHHRALTAAVHDLLSTLLWHGKLDARLRELLIMRIGWRTGSEYEWTQHWRVARLLDVPEADLLAVRAWQDAACFDERDRAVLAATDETLDAGTISDATWSACAAHLGTEELLEMVVAIGNWRLFSSLLRSLAIPLEPGVEVWPPDGTQPKEA